MALPMLRGCYRVPSTFSFSRLFLNERRILRPSPPSGAGGAAAAVRPYSSDRGQQRPTRSFKVVGFPNPLMWFRTRIYCFLIRAYFDKEFSIEEFTEGAQQAFSHVSGLLSRCQFEALEGLVSKELIGTLVEKCKLLPPDHRKALAASTDDIMYTSSGHIGIYYDDNERKFVSIIMHFWYLTSAHISEDYREGTRAFHVTSSEGEVETKIMLAAIYEFRREFSKDVPPDWIITRIHHSKLLP